MQFAIGLVTLIAGFALAAIIIWFGEFQYVLQSHKTYYATFRSAPGLQPKVPVRRAGIRIGEVQKVEYSSEYSLVVATITLDGDNILREGDEPTIDRSLLGDTYVDIDTRPDMQGVKDRPIVPAGSTLEGVSPPNLTKTIDEASDMVPNANKTLTQIETTAKAWAQVGDRTNSLIARNQEQIDQIVRDAQITLEKMNRTLDSIDEVLNPETRENLRITIRNVRDASKDLRPTIESANRTLDNIDQLAQDLKTVVEPFKTRSESIANNVDVSLANLNPTLIDVRAVVNEIRNGNGSLQRLYRSDELYMNLDAASVLLVQNLAKLRCILDDAQVFADKIARHPGELGVQGVFTRDKGLKEVPPGAVPRKHGFFKRDRGVVPAACPDCPPTTAPPLSQ
ncbi:paraquat-inducible protein B [Planctomycetes bacterium Pan216]|uniref:Paraquat-inducible protein B n=2 Tax=Kolteria novifilia TaxID=2527975 RepID=A0A518B5L9_9BACT|nr:paraquat-inducible protein B [Planctomycetes bacterium Pan216]